MSVLVQHVEVARTVREKLGIPRAALARAIGRSLSHLQNIESGVTAPSRMDATAISSVLGEEPETLFSRIRDQAQAT